MFPNTGTAPGFQATCVQRKERLTCQSDGVYQPIVTSAVDAIMFSQQKVFLTWGRKPHDEARGLLALLMVFEQLVDLHQGSKMIPQATLQITFKEDCTRVKKKLKGKNLDSLTYNGNTLALCYQRSTSWPKEHYYCYWLQCLRYPALQHKHGSHHFPNYLGMG